MFKLGQILTTTQFIRNCHRIIRELEASPQPVLITQRNGSHMVFVNAEIFEELAYEKLQKDGIEASPSHLRAILDTPTKAY